MPATFGGRCGRSAMAERCPGCDGTACAKDMVSHPERANTLAARVAAMVALRRAERRDKRVAVVLFNFPPNAGAVGTAAYLAVFASLHNTLGAMRDAGYSVEVPDTVDALRDRLLAGNAERYGTDANVAARISAEEHVRRQPWLDEIERSWGAAPGRAQSDGVRHFRTG